MKDTMEVWAIVEHGKPLQKRQQPIPEPKGTEVLIKVTHCGVCHSDLHLWDGYFDMGNGQKFSLNEEGEVMQAAMGHEILGTVAKLGPEAKSPEIGSSQIVYPWTGCGRCEQCDREDDKMCVAQRTLGLRTDGGLAEYVIVPDPKYLVDPGDLDHVTACTYGCSGITAFSAVQTLSPIDANEPVVVIGAGGLGLGAIAILKSQGHQNTIAVDIREEILATAKDAGARAAVNSSSADAAKEIMDTAGRQIMGIIDFVNNSKTASLAQKIVGKGGKWIVVGLMGGSVEVPLVTHVLKNVSMIGVTTGNPRDLREFTKLAQQGVLVPIPRTTMPIDEVNTALEHLRDGKVKGRLVLTRS